jgi:hypothetical protein
MIMLRVMQLYLFYNICLMSNKHVIATLVIVGMIGMVATVFALSSMNFIPSASAVKDTRCAKHTQGGGDPHDAENPHNPHDTQLGFNTGNPHDACVGS